MISIVDYGIGNIRAIANLYLRIGVKCEVASHPDQIRRAARLILPGVGSFDWAMRRLAASGLREALDFAVLELRRPVLGICVGMQMMANGSEEGTEKGLGWIPGRVKKFQFQQLARYPLPHMGWNTISPVGVNRLLAALDSDSRFYFLHSYYFDPVLPENSLCLTDYGGLYSSGVVRDNIYGVQFHPEKSHGWGSLLLRNFAEI
jgi:glutamine amidotransferase